MPRDDHNFFVAIMASKTTFSMFGQVHVCHGDPQVWNQLD